MENKNFKEIIEKHRKARKRMLSQLAIFLEEQYGLIADPEHTLKDAIAVLDFFIQKFEREEPQARNEIAILKQAKETLEVWE